MNRFIGSLCLALAFSSFGLAQEAKQEITLQGSGFFTKDTTGRGVTHKETNSAGLLAGYRFNLNKWLAAEGNYDYFSNSQKYAASVANGQIKTNVHGVTGSAVVRIPTSFVLKPYALAGGGALVFNPRDVKGVDNQTRGAFVYGGGADYSLTKHFVARAEYRGFVYKTPDFSIANLKTDKYTHSAVPSIGLAYAF
jgi:outer membrane immunogenic protein